MVIVFDMIRAVKIFDGFLNTIETTPRCEADRTCTYARAANSDDLLG